MKITRSHGWILPLLAAGILLLTLYAPLSAGAAAELPEEIRAVMKEIRETPGIECTWNDRTEVSRHYLILDPKGNPAVSVYEFKNGETEAGYLEYRYKSKRAASYGFGGTSVTTKYLEKKGYDPASFAEGGKEQLYRAENGPLAVKTEKGFRYIEDGKEVSAFAFSGGWSVVKYAVLIAAVCAAAFLLGRRKKKQ